MAADLRPRRLAAEPLSETGEFVSWQLPVGVDFRRRYSIAFHQLTSEIEDLLPRRSRISCNEISPHLIPTAIIYDSLFFICHGPQMRATQVKQAFRCRTDYDLSKFPRIINTSTGWLAFAGHDSPWVTNKGRWYYSIGPAFRPCQPHARLPSGSMHPLLRCTDLCLCPFAQSTVGTAVGICDGHGTAHAAGYRCSKARGRAGIQ
jgi:hypothetical protein